MRPRGVTLIETLLAALILVVVIGIIVGLFTITDTAFRTEVPLRQAQIEVQRILDAVAKEASETNTAYIHFVSVAGEALPAGAGSALVFVSARDTNGEFAMDATTMQPSWQKTIAYVPMLDADGEVEIRRFSFPAGSSPDAPGGLTPTITLDSTNVTLEWYDSGGALQDPPGTQVLARTAGIVTVTRVQSFAMNNPSKTAGTGDDFGLSGGGSYAADLWTISVTLRKQLANKEYDVTVSTSTQGRN